MNDISVCLLSASHRAEAQSRRIADYLNSEYLDGKASLIDLFEAHLPMWEGLPLSPDDEARVNAVKATAEAADAFVFIVPEWHGMAPAGLKNFLLWCGAQQLAHKPVLLVGVSASAGGAFVIAELRGSGYKNARLLYLPEHLMLRDVKDLWSGQECRASDVYLGKRARYALDMLTAYAKAIKPLRAQLCEGLAEFPNGMS
ncbi:NADPH-dependent FMN reductase [Thalassolituus sp. LLYu03]|uniref:NADPH-dependent FMN reductase n=1 Tax=Thalassolituus sp. LLYu03 TaxID=3421656 RepID=UPI003D26596E